MTIMFDRIMAADGGTSLSTLWRNALVRLAVVWGVIFALFWPDWTDIIRKWSDDATFNHCFFLVPILIWLIWMRRKEVSQLSPAGWPMGLIWLGGATLCWFLGALADVSLFRQAGVVGILQGAVLTLLGPQVSRGLLFPLFYMIFLVPFGTELTPPLQRVTAGIIMPLLHVAGVPATVDGLFITVPSGYFRVAEACSGLNFLIAMLALGALIANLCFKTSRARILFMIACVVVPVITNGLRAWGTIMLAENYGIEYAEGSTHIMYGWIVFAIGMALTIGTAWRWFDRAPEDPAFDPIALPKPKGGPAGVALMVSAIAIPALALGWSMMSAQAGARTLPNVVALPNIVGWERARMEGPLWEPQFDGGDHYLLGSYRNAQGNVVDLAIVLYGTQEQGREVAGFGQGAGNEELHWSWVGQENGALSGYRAERLVGPNKVARIAWTSMIVNGKPLTNSAQVKVETLKSRIVMGNRSAAALVISTIDKPGQNSDRILSDFGRAIGGPEQLAREMLKKAEGEN